MKIYIAGSWRNAKMCIQTAKDLRREGYEVDCFCEIKEGRSVFSFDEVGDYENKSCIEMLKEQRVWDAFCEDVKWLDWADGVVMVLPCGKSAHLEAGYAKGKGKFLYILGEFPKGEYDVMYGFADKLLTTVKDLKDELKSCEDIEE
jgi:hypothetical protein